MEQGAYMNETGLGDTIISVKDLHVYFYTNQRCNRVINGVSFDIKRGKTLCIVGESGCGKSVTANAIMRLLSELSRIEKGSITYRSLEGDIRIDQLERNGPQMRKLRGKEMAIIFQDPMTALNPVYSIGFQINEMLQAHDKGLRKRAATARSIGLLKDMGIPLPEQRVHEYPHQFSGGMRQRGMIAMAMANAPRVLIADEPTTALDVSIQAQIFELIEQLKTERHTAIMLITHDMGVVAELADEVAVMYMGNIVEFGTIKDVLESPAHPYTKALLKSIPILGRGKNQKLDPIRGNTPDSLMRPAGCQFCPRCDYAKPECEKSLPGETALGGVHRVMCYNYADVANHE